MSEPLIDLTARARTEQVAESLIALIGRLETRLAALETLVDALADAVDTLTGESDHAAD